MRFYKSFLCTSVSGVVESGFDAYTDADSVRKNESFFEWCKKSKRRKTTI